jgi:hypothetical protein
MAADTSKTYKTKDSIAQFHSFESKEMSVPSTDSYLAIGVSDCFGSGKDQRHGVLSGG